ncbi:MAG: TraR/DksA C4-type zinc finger protein [Helicobacter sp.]|uniref:RNA polymerase-binding protein DksA n=2 Tax=Helicobacter bilis TaxID=37372 RepID=C3XG00_9HELI|nr:MULTISPECIES: TraR/DksA C4-type zinc finger protein [Helicobacter]AQQ58800.1 RNA polymerase-binding protein DksA [Helicobacter bilis]EEO23939.1 RNA polymerase-binding protein DksA [Helicobacter bilis ATCC 43879]MCI7410440.1 TraR/DksA C4-type zinc finger protein [Helicobacter bilis]MDD7297173.1 TraR/DksA C4-type zinc finger protein [Helicobacter bilis]MDY4400190.1 TraR/DksA C4-type zinc finger protein [Helicobacter bilis]
MRDEDLLSLRQTLEKRLEYLDGLSLNLHKSLQEMSALKLNENADIISTQSQLRFDDSMLERNQKEMKEISASLAKFDDGIYGICEMCEDEIGIERLQAKPHARFCINCREIYEKSEKQKERT